MVNYLCIFIFIFIGWLAVASGEVVVESNIDQNTAQANFPLTGTLTVTYDKKALIDPTSFKVEGRPLEASLVKNVSLVGDQRLSIYSFSWPAQEKGEHTLPSISVVIEEKTYYSKPSTYTIEETTPLAPSSTKFKETPILRLEAFVKGPSTLLVGERTTLVYRLVFNQSIDLTKSELPFIDPPSFLKVGDAQIREEQQGAWSIQEITQVIEASKSGTFYIGPSFIEGFAYQTNERGKKYYDSQLLRAEAPAVEIIVKAFSLENQPLSFKGAIGRVKAELILETSAQVQVGDALKLLLTISGISNITEFELPSLTCQPGFSGRFHVREYLLATDIKKGIKKFQLELRPLTSLITEIPSIEISSFDPQTKKYHITNTPQVPLTVQPLKYLASSATEITQITPDEEFIKSFFHQPALQVKIRHIQVDPRDLQIPFYQREWMLLSFPLGVIFLVWQYFKYKKGIAQHKTKLKKSEIFLKQAEQIKDRPQEGLKLLEKAILWYLIEEGIITSPKIENIPHESQTEKAHALLLQIQSLQYGNKQEFDYEKLIQAIRIYL